MVASSTLPPTCSATLSAPSPAPSTRTPPLGLILHLFSSKNNLTHAPDLSVFSATSHLTTESAQQTKATIFMATPFLSAEMKYMIILINEAIDENASKSFGIMILMGLTLSHDSGSSWSSFYNFRTIRRFDMCSAMSKPSAAVPLRHLFVLQFPLRLVVLPLWYICIFLNVFVQSKVLQHRKVASTASVARLGHPHSYIRSFDLKIDDR